jgi:hypothetical protein
LNGSATRIGFVPQDEEHLSLLTIFHYVVAGVSFLFALFPIFHLIFGLLLALKPQSFSSQNGGPPAFLGWMFVGLAGVFILIGFAFAALVFFAGRSLAARKRYTFCLVMAGIECAFFPFGTALGVFTLLVLLRPSVKPLFNSVAVPPPIHQPPPPP